MNTNLQFVRHDFKGLTKAQLVRRLEFAEFMMSRMRDLYQKDLAKPEPFHFAHAHERGFASAMNMALGFIVEDPDRPKVTEEVA